MVIEVLIAPPFKILLKACVSWGAQAREELIESVCHKEVGVYQQIFSTTGETALIERTERRYAWLRRRLRAKAEIWAIFPEAWRLPQRMCLLFAQVTRTHLAEILENKVRLFRNHRQHSVPVVSYFMPGAEVCMPPWHLCCHLVLFVQKVEATSLETCRVLSAVHVHA